jgi:hypothetical protein
LKKGESITIHFLARAEPDRPIEVLVHEGQAPYAPVGDPKSISLNSQWREVTHTVTSPHALVDGLVEIRAGQSCGIVEISEVRLEKRIADGPSK